MTYNVFSGTLNPAQSISGVHFFTADTYLYTVQYRTVTNRCCLKITTSSYTDVYGCDFQRLINQSLINKNFDRLKLFVQLNFI